MTPLAFFVFGRENDALFIDIMLASAKRLGNSHPHVEAARSHLAALRKHERELGWTELEQLHYDAIEKALDKTEFRKRIAMAQGPKDALLAKQGKDAKA